MSLRNKSILKISLLLCLSSFIFTGCSTVHSARLANQCNADLARASAELEQTKLDGFGSTVAWTKAASLLTAARIQQQFDKFPNCINKVARARYYITRSKVK